MTTEKSSWVRALGSMPGPSWRNALNELLVITVLSVMPLVAKLLVRMYHGYEGAKLGFLSALVSIFKEGELLLLAVGLVASVIWMSGRDFDRARFNERVWFTVLSTTVLASSVFFIGFNPDFKTLPPGFVTVCSFVLYGLSCAMYLLMAVLLKFEAADFSKELDRGERLLTDALTERKS